ncbi:hypothetical protein TNCV_4023231 [Trichonephila clavipes]|nr:hypothetical protein TNCV_4023231 [Trichonephila clavipes]
MNTWKVRATVIELQPLETKKWPSELIRPDQRMTIRSLVQKIVKVQYFVRGGFVGHRSRVSSKHLSSLIFRSSVFDSSGVKKGLRCSCKMHVWVPGPPKISTAAGSGYVTALALYYRTFPLRKV